MSDVRWWESCARIAEDDDELQDLWARMLGNSADAGGTEVRCVYISILIHCTSLDVRILAALYSISDELRGASMRGSFWLMKQSRYSPPIWGQGASRQRPISLVRCGIWVASEVIASDTLADGDKQMWNVSITALGVGLVEACTL
jgi:hypothetical protein